MRLFFAITLALFAVACNPTVDQHVNAYTLEAWHEKLGRQTAQVTIGPGQKQSASMTFATAPK